MSTSPRSAAGRSEFRERLERDAGPRDAGASPPRSPRSPRSPSHGEPRALPPAPTPGVFETPSPLGEGTVEYSSTAEAKEDAPFIEWGSVSTFFAVLVIVNAVYIGVDTHARATAVETFNGALPVFIEVVFFAAFAIELFLRIKTDKCPGFFQSHWNLMDAALVGASGMDLLFEIIAIGQSSQNVGKLRAVRLLKITRFVRVVRLLRVFRFKRVIRVMRGFILLVKAIVGACQALGWVTVMFMTITYMCGIITTEFIGLDNEFQDPFIEDWFGDLFKSMFTLFQISTLSSWGEISRHVADTHGSFWHLFFMCYVLGTNTILMNVALATLIENVFSLTSDVKEAQAGGQEGDSWMKTPESLASEPDAEEEEEVKAAATAAAAQNVVHVAGGVPQQSASERIAMQTLSEVFDLVSTHVGVEGVNQRKLATQASLKDAMQRHDVQLKVAQACPAIKVEDERPDYIAEKIYCACPKHIDKEGLNRQELAEACMALSGEMSMNHFVLISQALQKMERHVDHELVHLNKHQRKMNRRFLKLRHRLRKVYHFDGAPRKMVEMVNEMKRRNLENQVAQGAGKASKGPVEESGEISLSEDSSEDGGETKW